MIRSSKIALALLIACSVSVILFAAACPHSVDARHYLYSRSRKFFRHPPSSRTDTLPAVIFWAWERPEDLRFLTPDQAGVAFLAKTIYLQPPVADLTGSSPSFTVRPRLQPLRITPGTPLIAVVRMETPAAPRFSSLQQNQSASHAFTYSDTQRSLLASEIAATQSISGVSAIQIDFDAPSSAQPFYSALLQEVRSKLPPSLPLSITALASWCIGDPWLAQLPPATIDEAVPMLFRMGSDSANVAKFLHSGDDFPVAACRGSRGLSTDETLSNDLLTTSSTFPTFDPREKRVYVFAPRSWTQSAAEKILQELQP